MLSFVWYPTILLRKKVEGDSSFNLLKSDMFFGTLRLNLEFPEDFVFHSLRLILSCTYTPDLYDQTQSLSQFSMDQFLHLLMLILVFLLSLLAIFAGYDRIVLGGF